MKKHPHTPEVLLTDVSHLKIKFPKVGMLVRRKKLLLTFAARHGVVPHYVAVLQDARDGLRAVRLDEALLAQERDGTAQLKVLAETLPVHWDTWVGALVVTEGCEGTNTVKAKAKFEIRVGRFSKTSDLFSTGWCLCDVLNDTNHTSRHLLPFSQMHKLQEVEKHMHAIKTTQLIGMHTRSILLCNLYSHRKIGEK